MVFDLGTANILIYVKGEGIVVNEPSVVTINTETNKPIAVGEEARDMLGKTPGKISSLFTSFEKMGLSARFSNY